MSQEQYTLGRNVQQYIADFHAQYKCNSESVDLLPQPMHSVVSFINETVKNFELEHNLGKESQQAMLAHCRPAAESYIFGKLF